ncbi:hypothetical protein B296_00032305 [Ensete ventricosum]|uniref:Uncharacterized protein n=1 Tax=Ensete ventricosum TaxID=4639 RepID=A0A427ACF4_ENSVE|nr:hypothetical protein B296_00032305 [Ensete ventricosum]
MSASNVAPPNLIGGTRNRHPRRPPRRQLLATQPVDADCRRRFRFTPLSRRGRTRVRPKTATLGTGARGVLVGGRTAVTSPYVDGGFHLTALSRERVRPPGKAAPQKNPYHGNQARLAGPTRYKYRGAGGGIADRVQRGGRGLIRGTLRTLGGTARQSKRQLTGPDHSLIPAVLGALPVVSIKACIT